MRFAPVQDTRFDRSIEAAGRYNANGYKLAGAVRQFCIIDTLVVIHTAGIFVIILAAGGLPPVRCKSEFVGAIVAAARTAVHLLLDKSLDLFFAYNVPGFLEGFHGIADGGGDGIGVSGSIFIVLLDFRLDHLCESLHLRVNGNADIGLVRHSKQRRQLNLKIAVHFRGRDLHSACILHNKQECFCIVVQPAVNAHLMHDVRFIRTGDLDFYPPSRLAAAFNGFDVQQFQVMCFSAYPGFPREVCVSRTGAAHSAGDYQRTTGERLRQQGGTGGGVARFFPTHVVCPPITMFIAVCDRSTVPAVKARAFTAFASTAPGSATATCIFDLPTAPATYAFAPISRGLILPGTFTVQDVAMPLGAAAM
nr:MAG: hypothetical protein [Bacteriophage sp.]